MEYLSVAEARTLPGLRLVLSRGAPGPWGEALKSVLACKSLSWRAVAQVVGGDNPELVEWSGQASAPVLAWNDEPPRSNWLDQLMLAERLAPATPLLGQEPGQRILVVGMCREIAGEGGLGWHRRQLLTGWAIESGRAPPYMEVMARRYGFSQAAFAAAEPQLVQLLNWFGARLGSQAEGGSEYLVGDGLTAADLYLANFVGMFHPLPAAMNPMPDNMRVAYGHLTPALAEALSPALLEHRDRLYRRHIETPLDF